MFMRIVRFTDASSERLNSLIARINEADGPPPGVRMSGTKLLLDEANGVAISLQEYETAKDMEDAARIFDAMDTSETPGTRVSIDECEVKLELSA